MVDLTTPLSVTVVPTFRFLAVDDFAFVAGFAFVFFSPPTVIGFRMIFLDDFFLLLLNLFFYSILS